MGRTNKAKETENIEITGILKYLKHCYSESDKDGKFLESHIKIEEEVEGKKQTHFQRFYGLIPISILGEKVTYSLSPFARLANQSEQKLIAREGAYCISVHHKGISVNLLKDLVDATKLIEYSFSELS